MRITGYSPKLPDTISNRPDEGKASGAPSFGNELKTMVEDVDGDLRQADEAMQQAAVKGASNIHETMIQLEEADVSLRMMLKVRGKAIEAYQEIMRMQF